MTAQALRLALVSASVALGVCLALGGCERRAPEKQKTPRASDVASSLIANGDGTVTDTSTGLIWEQKCDCPGTPHHFETTYLWSGDGGEQTIWDWLEALNKEGGSGFGGHGDWRIPNVKELVSLVDYERAAPAVSPPLGACASGPYWTSTTFGDFPAHALVVGFAAGGVDDQLKTSRALVRAVRGPVPRTTSAALETHGSHLARLTTKPRDVPPTRTPRLLDLFPSLWAGSSAAIQAATAPAWAASADDDRLHEAVRDGDLDSVRELIGRGADVNAADEDGLTPLLQAIFSEEDAIARTLIKAGADVNKTSDVSGRALRELGAEVEPDEHPRLTPLMVAVFLANRPAVERLLGARADVNAAGDDGVRPLHLAAFNPDDEIATLLLDAGADVNARSSGGDTPLHEAATRGNAAVAALLIARGANVNAIDAQLRTALDQAESESNAEVASVLEKHGAVAMQRSVDANVDVVGHDPLLTPLVDAATLEALVPAGPRPLGLALGAGRLWWSEYTNDRLQSARLDGSDVRSLTVANLSGPIGVAVDVAGRKLFWTSDCAYPRRVQRAELDGSGVTDVASGTDTNRPSAIAVDPVSANVFWTESIAGTIRRAGLDGTSVEEIVTSGISSVSDRADAREFKALGIAVDGASRKIYWTDMIDAQIVRAGLDGTGVETVVGAAGGLEAPAGIVVAGGNMYWTDPGASKIQRAKVDGSEIEDVLDADDGLIEPYALALDHDAGRLYWTDASDGTIRRATLAGQDVRVVIASSANAHETGEPGSEAAAQCTREASAAGPEYVRRTVNAIATCLGKVDALKAVWRRQSDAARASASCLRQLDRVAGGAEPSRSLEGMLRTRLARACGARLPEPLGGAVGTLVDKRCAPERRHEVECLVSAFRDAAYSRVAMRFRRAGEWLEEIRPFVERTATADAHNAIANLDAVSGALHAMTASPAVVPESPAVAHISRSGQITSYAAARAGGRHGWSEVPDDGALRAGAPPGYRDNGDGTISDLNTGLMWEKKCDGCGGLHDSASVYAPASVTGTKGIADWLSEMNGEHGTGFAGHRDWRLPTIKELQSIVDYGRFNPAVPTAFDGAACGLGCTDVASAECSCTAMTEHCSATSYASSPKRAFALGFHLGIIGEVRKSDPCAVRAVRGGGVTGAGAAAAATSDPARASGEQVAR